MTKKILLAENPRDLTILRSISQPVPEASTEIRDLAKEMLTAMHRASGVGLSAVQIGELKRLIVAEYLEAKPPIQKMVLINPEITWVSKNEVLDEEGCLSLPHVYGMVRRPEKIAYHGLDENGAKVEGKASGLLARIIQHEIDHLNGVLFVDLVEGDLYTYEKQDDTEKI